MPNIFKLVVLSIGAFLCRAASAQSIPDLLPFPNPSGRLATYNTAGGPIDMSGPFFQALGTNGRTCASCHRPAEGWSVSANEIERRFFLSLGMDPVFRTNDGSNCDHDINTNSLPGRLKAYSLLISRGLFRIALAVPDTAEFSVVSVENPYGCNEISPLSVYRRPLPAANLRVLSTVMWDGRESSTQTGTQPITYATNPADLMADLAHQALDAVNGHEQASAPPTTEQQQAIAAFEESLATAQIYDYGAGMLDADGAAGGPAIVGGETIPQFFIGINDPFGGNPKGIPFTPTIFNLFGAWANPLSPHGSERRASIARGEELFNSKAFAITGVAGLNDVLNLGSITGTCGTCHDSPNTGNHSVSAPLNIGVADPDSPLDVSYLPVITLQNKTTMETLKTTDPGRAFVTGSWSDIGKVKGPVLRGLASRAPYFHNGSAATLDDVVKFYDKRFQIGFTEREKRDLVAFLSSL